MARRRCVDKRGRDNEGRDEEIKKIISKRGEMKEEECR